MRSVGGRYWITHNGEIDNFVELRAELEAFVDAARSRKEPRTNGASGRAALELAGRVMASIQEHAARVNLLGGRQSAGAMGDRKVAGLDVFATHDKTR